MSILEWQFDGAPWAILDVETTGLTPGFDRIVEISVAHLDPHSDTPRLVFDTLVNPRRKMDTDIHGIRDVDVVGAPYFSEIAQEFAGSLVGRVIAAHNAFFDMSFLAYELEQIGVKISVPYVCTMNLVEVLGLGRRSSLAQLSDMLGIEIRSHIASEDALAAAHLLVRLSRAVREKRIPNFGALLSRIRAEARYAGSWCYLPLHDVHPLRAVPRSRPRVSRSQRQIERPATRIDYGMALIEALADFVLTDEEEARLKCIQAEAGLQPEQIRAAHSAALMWIMSRAAADGWVDDLEAHTLHVILEYLRRLGWAPGDKIR